MRSEPTDQSVEGQAERRDEEREWWLTVLPLTLCLGVGVIVDIGTGDGHYVYRSARANPDKFYIGIDVQPKALEKLSEKIHRKPEKGGLPNVLFVQAPVEELALTPHRTEQP